MIDKDKLEQWSLALSKGGRVNAKEVVDAWNEIFTKGMPRRAYTSCVSCLKRMIGDLLRFHRFQEEQTAETNEPIETETDKVETDIKPKIGRKKKSN